jgi:uncharacterized protein (TIGR03435 family)
MLRSRQFQKGLSEAQWKSIVERLLKDRFGLAFHTARKELAVFALVAGPNGPKLKQSQGDPNGVPSLFFKEPGILPASNARMTDLAAVMQESVLDRPVVDRTGLTGRFDFRLKWTPDQSQFGGMAALGHPTDSAPDLSKAMEEQLGLKLESTRAQVDVLVIDHIATVIALAGH